VFGVLSHSHHCKALNSLICADVPSRNYSLTHTHCVWRHIICWYCTVLLFRLYAAQRPQWEVQTKGFDVICTGGVRSDDGGRRAAKRRRSEVISPGAPAKCVRAARATSRAAFNSSLVYSLCRSLDSYSVCRTTYCCIRVLLIVSVRPSVTLMNSVKTAERIKRGRGQRAT